MKDRNCGTADTLFEKDNCIPEPLNNIAESEGVEYHAWLIAFSLQSLNELQDQAIVRKATKEKEKKTTKKRNRIRDFMYIIF